MGGFGTAVVVAALTAVGALTAAPAYADETVVVEGTAFPDPARVNLSFVGCADLYQRGPDEIVPMIGPGPGQAPSGTRSVGFDLGGGNAIGALFTVPSVLATSTASVAVNAAAQARGVAYAGYREPADKSSSLLWLGRSELVTPGGAWQTVEATTRTYIWTKYDMTTQQPVAAGPGTPMTVAAFAASRGGDGPGVFTVGFGCDGTPFSMDQLRLGTVGGGVTTYDVEGLRTKVQISGPSAPVSPGDEVTITGRLDTGTGDPVPHATMVLEERVEGSGRWRQVLVAPVNPKGVATARVRPERATHYRWRFVERPLAEGSTSLDLLLDVLTLPTDDPSPSDSPSHPPTPTPSDPSSDPSTSSPSPTTSPSDAGSSPASSPTPSSPSTSPSTTSPTAPATDGSASPSGSDSPGAG